MKGVVVVLSLVLCAMCFAARSEDRPANWASIAMLQDLATLGFLPPMTELGQPVGYIPCIPGDRPLRPASNYEVAVYGHIATQAWQTLAKSEPRDPKAKLLIHSAKDRLEWLWETYQFELRQMGAVAPKFR